ncbi:hypothetical protein V2H45_22525 [Tumidithrix elongata RA019]|uniref:Uncharacterized protein n=1 Tax=Tumidithrix elongata BACA0141 TaxID=2716417 RepID=A0AAW9Q5S3_9CYAN|nr:hypothetical protein [Tumidithrix elongata RA019]
MFISKFSIEDWQNNKNYGSLEVPSGWGDIEAAIGKLDGDRCSLANRLEASSSIRFG